MTELVVISGKGGTGKTSILASFAALAGPVALADCDVDAADLHLVLSPRLTKRHDFFSGHEAVIRQEDCVGCGACLAYCRYGAVSHDSADVLSTVGPDAFSACRDCSFCERSCSSRQNAAIREMMDASNNVDQPVFAIDPLACQGCGVCVWFCPVQAIEFRDRLCGEWMISDTRFGPMVHAKLGAAAENSGKLVSKVRTEARRLAKKRGLDLLLIDGPPGIGCPVIASVTGADLVLVVAEPSLSGLHDARRAADLTRHFGIRTLLCINKWDLNEEVTVAMEEWASHHGLQAVGRLRYDAAVTEAQIRKRPVVEHSRSGISRDIKDLWDAVREAAACPQGSTDRMETATR